MESWRRDSQGRYSFTFLDIDKYYQIWSPGGEIARADTPSHS